MCNQACNSTTVQQKAPSAHDKKFFYSSITPGDHQWSQIFVTTASAAVSAAPRASPIDPSHHRMTASLSVGDLERYTSLGLESRGPSPISLPSTFALDFSRPSSTSTLSPSNLAYSQAPYHQRSASLSLNTPQRPALPGLSTLAAFAASAPQLRYGQCT